KNELNSHEQRLQQFVSEAENLQSKIDNLVKRWEDENAKEMPPVNDTCPTCNQTLPTGDIEKQKEEITKKWNQNLLDVKATIEADGKRFNQDLKAKNSDIEAQKALIAEKKAELKSISEELHSFIEEPVEPEVDIKPLILAALEKHVEYNQ